MSSLSSASHRHRFLLAGLLFITTQLYLPGLSGDFILDDTPHLSKLEAINKQPDITSYIGYVLGGTSSSIGRPLSLLSFALQAGDWPSRPYAFKAVNIGIHLLNGILVYLLSLLIFQQLSSHARQAKSLALAVTAFWLINPLQVSTVLYVIQRMTELATLFSLLGLYLYVKGRTKLIGGEPNYKLMTLGVVVAMLFGILSKETAVLTGLFILIAEATVLQQLPRPAKWRPWSWIFIKLPLLLLVAYLLPIFLPHLFEQYPTRPFTALERLLTESRVVLDYLANILLPRPNHFGLFHLDYTISRGILTPPATLISISLHAVILTLAFVMRKKAPAASFGILFYYAGHTLESTLLNLEIYFEHRNYLPLLGIGIALVSVLHHVALKLQIANHTRARSLIIGGYLVYLFALSVILYHETRLWGEPVKQAAVWAEAHPHSHRSQGYFADTLVMHGRFHEAAKVYEKNLRRFKDDTTVPIVWLELQCFDDSVPLPPQDLLTERLHSGFYYNSTLAALDEIVALKEKKKCGALDNRMVYNAIDLLEKNPKFQTTRTKKSLFILKARLYATEKNYKMAVGNYSSAYSIIPSVDILISVAEIHASQGNTQWFIDTAKRITDYCGNHPIECIEYRQRINNIKAAYRQLTEQH